MRSRLMLHWGIVLAIVCAAGCASGIPKSEYSPLAEPRQTYEFARKAVAADDPEAFYYCLSEHVRKQISLSSFKFGWALASSYFYLLLDSKLDSIEKPPPEPKYQRPYLAKMTLSAKDLKVSFLLCEEEKQWRLVVSEPMPYPLPNVKSIKPQERLLWRVKGNAFYQNTPEDWLHPSQIQRNAASPSMERIPWRTSSQRPFYEGSLECEPSRPQKRQAAVDGREGLLRWRIVKAGSSSW